MTDGFLGQIPDVDPDETGEWIDSFESVAQQRGRARASFLLARLEDRAQDLGIDNSGLLVTPYINTIPRHDEPWFPGDETIERRIRAVIRWNAVAKKIGQAVRNDGPQTHLVKSGTPTMGGVLILISIGITTLLWGDLTNKYVWTVLVVTLAGAWATGARLRPWASGTITPSGSRLLAAQVTISGMQPSGEARCFTRTVSLVLPFSAGAATMVPSAAGAAREPTRGISWAPAHPARSWAPAHPARNAGSTGEGRGQFIVLLLDRCPDSPLAYAGPTRRPPLF